MHPVIFEFGDFTIYSYGLFIVLGAFSAYTFLKHASHTNYGISHDKISTLLIWIFVTAFIGGKLFFYLEDPEYYLNNPSRIYSNLGSGFVFYGSLLFAVPTTIWFFNEERWNVWGMLDLLAFTTLIVHAFGRMGCFLAGCCHGVPTDSFLGVVFTDPKSQAMPLNTALHPTQLYEISALTFIFIFLLWFQKRKKFDGQLFLIYVIMYSAARSIIEVFRGDEARGYLIDGFISHSQGISLVLIILSILVYFKRQSISNRVQTEQNQH